MLRFLLALLAVGGAAADGDLCTTFADACRATLGTPVCATEACDTTEGELFTVAAGEGRFFELVLDSETVTGAVEVAVTAVYGDVDIYASDDGSMPTRWNYDFSAHTTAVRDVLVIDADALASGTWTYNVFVYAVRASKFQVVVSDEDDAIVLSDGMPQRDTVEAQAYTYFQFTLGEEDLVDGEDLFFSLAVLSGEPDLLVSTTIEFPKLTDSEDDTTISIRRGGDYISVDSAAAATYHVGVYGEDASTFALTVQYDQEALLCDSVPQTTFLDSLLAQTPFLFEAGPSLPDVSVSARPDNGQIFLYMGTADTDPATDNALWSSQAAFGDQAITVSSDDENYPADGQFWIIVLEVCCFLREVGVDLQASTSISATTLVQGVPAAGSVAEHEYKYYQVYTEDDGDDLVLQLTPLSGDPDLYVGCVFEPTGDKDGYPSNQAQHYNFSSWSSVTDTVTVLSSDPLNCNQDSSGAGGVTYVAVYGFQASSFTLTATEDWDTTTLYDGYPQTSTVSTGEYALFVYNLADNVDEVIITLSTAYGDADLYVTVDGTVPTRSHFDFFSMSSSADDVVTIDEADLPDPGSDINVAVYGWDDSGYSISASGQNSQLLQDSVSMTSYAAEGEMKYFRFIVDDDSGEFALDLIVTPLSGDVDLYFGTASTLGDDDLVSSQDGTVIESYSQAAVAAGTYYIGVKGVTGSTFSVLGHLADSITLVQLYRGTPQSGEVIQNDYQYYVLYLGAGTHELVISCTPLSGNVDLVVNKCPSYAECEDSDTYVPTINDYDYASRDSLSREVVDITVTDEEDVSVFIVGVYGYDESSFTVFSYLLDDITTVQENVPMHSAVSAGEYMTFRYPLSVEHEDVVITVTPFSGDPDLYVATEPIFRPNKTDYMWHSQHYSTDTVVVGYGDENACVDCDIYISVYGYSDADFSLLVALHSDVPVTLVDGQPQTGFLNASVLNQYVLRSTNPGQDVEINVTPYSGDPDLYVTLDGSKPDTDNYMFASKLWGQDRVYIDHTDDDFVTYCMSDDGCDIRIAVYAFYETTYSLVATTYYQATTLVLGTPHEGVVGNEAYEFYDVEVPVDATLTVSLTAQSGASAVYCACDHEFANSSQASWAIDRVYDSDQLYITTEDFAGAGCVAPFTLNVAVYGLSLATYTLIVSEPATLDWLSAGSSQGDELAYNAVAYYILSVSSEGEELTVTLTNTAGFALAYATSSDEYIPEYDADQDTILCDGHDCEYETTADKVSFSVNSGESTCFSCYYVVAVIGKGASYNAYSILVSSGTTATTLNSGIPTAGAVSEGQYEYFHVSVTTDTADLVLSMTVFSGDPDLFVDVAPNVEPSLETHLWMSAYYGADTLLIPASSLVEACVPSGTQPCEYYIGVYGDSNSTFSLTASVMDDWANPITLIPGEPQSGFVNDSAMAYYQVSVSQDTDAMRVTLSPMDGGDQDLFISLDGEQPTTAHHDYASYAVFADDEIIMHPFDKDCGDPCVAYIGVYGWTEGQFSIVASAGMVKLQASWAQYSTVDADDFAYFSIDVPADSLTSVTVSLAVYSGNADLYISTSDFSSDWPSVDSDSYLWKSLLTGSDVVTVDYTDENYCSDCTYYIGVRGRSDSTFAVTADVDDSPEVRLKAGTPQDVTLSAAGDEAYFLLFLGNTNEDVEFTLTVQGGDADMYVKENSEVECDPSDAATYDYTTAGSSTNAITVAAPDDLEDNPYFRVTVAATASNTVFTLVASTSQTPVTLQAGASIRQYVAEGGLEIFSFQMSSAALDLVVSVTALYGDADLFVSANGEAPYINDDDQIENYQWLSFYAGDETLTIDHTDPCGSHHATTTCDNDDWLSATTIYIAVFGYTDSSFSVVARQQDDHLELVTGEPVTTSTSSSSECSERDDYGACTSDDEQSAQVTYALFRVTEEDLEDDMHITITVQPACNATVEEALGECVPGCECDPAQMYVSSCNLGACTSEDMYPTALGNQFALHRAVDADRSSIFIAHDPLNPATGFCDTSLGECLYYVAVYSPAASTAVDFTLSVSLPNDVTLLPTASDEEGIISWGPDKITDSSGKNYDAFVSKGEAVHIELDICQGSPELYVCDDSCDTVRPSPDDYRWHALPGQLCEMDADSGEVTCDDIDAPVPLFSVDSAEIDSYLLGVYGGDGSSVYQINIATGANSHYLSSFQAGVVVSEVTETTAVVEWDSVALVDADGGVSVASAAYYVYAIKTGDLPSSSVLATACGLDTAHSSVGDVAVVTVTDGSHSATITGLAAGTTYVFNVAAACDEVCLFKATGSSADNTLTAAFTEAYSTTPAADKGTGSQVFGLSAGYVIGIGLAVGVALVAVAGYGRHRYVKAQRSRSQYDTQELAQGRLGRSLLSGRRKKHKYAQLDTAGDAEDDDDDDDEEIEITFDT